MDQPKMIKISKIIQENSNVKTFYFDFELKSKAGQFVMLWIPGIDQKPFSIASDDGTTFGLTIFKRGPLTEKLFNLNIGDRVGISGPYGTSFSLEPNTHYIMVAGGYGAAPLGFLVDSLILSEAKNLSKPQNKQPTIDFLMGARSSENLLFEKKLSQINNLNLHIATNDGSRGHKGLITDLLPTIIESINPSKDSSSPLEGLTRNDIIVCTCGPELMEKKVLDICNKYEVACEVSIERYMKCGVGVCGQCVVDDLGICMCQEGPVVKRELANKIMEFGLYHRDKTGSIINLYLL